VWWAVAEVMGRGHPPKLFKKRLQKTYLKGLINYFHVIYCSVALKAWVARGWSFTLAASNRDHCIIACSHHFIHVLFIAHILLVVNRTFNATPTGVATIINWFSFLIYLFQSTLLNKQCQN